MSGITISELRDLIEYENIKPSRLFDKEAFLNDEQLIKAMADKKELEAYRAAKRKEEQGLKEKETDASYIPD